MGDKTTKADDVNITATNAEGGAETVEKIQVTVHKIGSKKTLLELPADTTWSQVGELLGGPGIKVVDADGQDVTTKVVPGTETGGGEPVPAKVVDTPKPERVANVAVQRGFAGVA